MDNTLAYNCYSNYLCICRPHPITAVCSSLSFTILISTQNVSHNALHYTHKTAIMLQLIFNFVNFYDYISIVRPNLFIQ